MAPNKRNEDKVSFGRYLWKWDKTAIEEKAAKEGKDIASFMVEKMLKEDEAPYEEFHLSFGLSKEEYAKAKQLADDNKMTIQQYIKNKLLNKL